MKEPIRAIYLMHALHHLATAAISIFIPIYLLRIGYSLPDVFGYFIVYSATIFPLFLFGNYLAKRFGLKYVLVLSAPFMFLHVWMLALLPEMRFSLPLIAAVHAVRESFYWFPLHLFFATHSEDASMGKHVGRLHALPKLAGIAGPLAGGAVASLWGFNALFFLTAALYLASLIPLFFIPSFGASLAFSLRSLWVAWRNNARYALGEFFDNMRKEAEAVLWPIVIFLIFRNVFSIGVVGTVFAAGGALFMVFVGNLSDRTDRRRFLKAGAAIMIAIWIVRFYAQSQWAFYVLSVLAGFFGVMLVVPFTSIMYTISRKGSIAEFIIFREIPVALGRIAMDGIALLLVAHLPYTFLAAAASSVFFFFY